MGLREEVKGREGSIHRLGLNGARRNRHQAPLLAPSPHLKPEVPAFRTMPGPKTDPGPVTETITLLRQDGRAQDRNPGRERALEPTLFERGAFGDAQLPVAATRALRDTSLDQTHDFGV